MKGTCEVIGWLVDDCGTRMVVREADGATSLEQVCVESCPGIQIERALEIGRDQFHEFVAVH